MDASLKRLPKVLIQMKSQASPRLQDYTYLLSILRELTHFRLDQALCDFFFLHSTGETFYTFIFRACNFYRRIREMWNLPRWMCPSTRRVYRSIFLMTNMCFVAYEFPMMGATHYQPPAKDRLSHSQSVWSTTLGLSSLICQHRSNGPNNPISVHHPGRNTGSTTGSSGSSPLIHHS